MTMTIKYDGYPDRLACEDCGCTVACRRDGEPWASVLPDQSHFAAWFHALDVDEPGLTLDLTDGCQCHETYLRLTTLP